MLLQDVLYKVPIRRITGSTAVEINDLQIDSRKIKHGAAFVAVRGVAANGHEFIEKAIENGAIVVVCEEIPVMENNNVLFVQVEDSAAAAGYMSHNFFGKPSEALKLVGVTGTNGKTTIATLLYKLFTRLGYTCGLISTVENRIGALTVPATHTTPDAVSLNRLLKEMQEAGCSHVFMETSSHALHQHRVTGLQYTGALFSNITHDHLDYHQTFDEYIRVKKSFFDGLSSSAFAISNADDKRGTVMLQNTAARKYFYSLRTMADFKGKILDNSLSGLMMTVNDVEVHFRLIGEFNAYNLLAVYGAAICLGEEKQEVLTALSELSGAEGRFDFLISPKERLMAIVDYAHTPDAVEKLLSTVKSMLGKNQHMLTVVGCGGDRDKTKRPLMAAVAAKLSDKVVLTSDNPRSEEPESIIREMEAGLTDESKSNCLSITARREAIRTAVMLAKTGDVICVVGKGHEKYQEIKGVKHPFDDKAVLRDTFKTLVH